MENQGSFKKEYIKIRNLQAVDNLLTVKLDFSDQIRKYFKSDNLFVQYDRSIEKVDRSILFIPLLSTLITVAWATGADVYFESIDANFLKSLKRIETRFKKVLPFFRFSTHLHIQQESDVTHPTSFSSRSALLFTGGVDSLSSYLKHRQEKPALIAVWGADIPTAEMSYWNRVKLKLADFAKNEHVEIYFIKTNSREIVKENLLKNFLGSRHWWLEVAHGLVLTGVSAPLLADDFATLLLASSQYPENYQGPSGSHFFLKETVSFGNTRIYYDCPELTRHEKVKYLLKENPACHRCLIVCFDAPRFYGTQRALNCGTCEKCLRTLASLTLEGVDPQDCNFEEQGIDGNFKLMRTYLENHLIAQDKRAWLVWKDIQEYVLPNLQKSKNMLPCAKVFFEWFQSFDPSELGNSQNMWASELLKYYYLAKCKGARFASARFLDAIVRKLQYRVARVR